MKKAAAVTTKKTAAVKTKKPAVKATPKKATKLTPKKEAKIAKKLEPASIDEPVTMAPRDLEADLAQVVVTSVKAKGSTLVTWKRILEILGLPAFVEEREWGLKIFDALIDRGIVEKGVLNHDAEETKRLLSGEPATMEVLPQGVKVTAVQSPGTRLITVPIENVVVCSLNPRKRIDEAKIEEMADSILEHDIVQPPVARPGRYQDTYEVVFGQRRLLGKRRAIAKAKELKEPIAETIQLLVREMDDRTVLEEAWVENLQRVDVGAREEVEGFQAMLDLRDDSGKELYNISTLAKKLGKAKSYVSNRMKLKTAPEEMWQALEAGVIGLRHLIEVGRLPDAAARKKAASMVLKPKFRPEGQPLTVRETMEMLKDEFMVSLRGCAWDLKDETLVPVKKDKKGERLCGGACADCPCRAGSDPDLAESLSSNAGKQGIDANSCMMPSCYQEKQEALWKRTMHEASEKGSKVLSEEEAKKVFMTWGSGGVSQSSSYVSLSENPSYQETGHHAGEDTLPAWGEMIKKVDPKDVVVARSETSGEVHYLLPREKAIELAEASLGKKGKDSPFANRPGAKRSSGGGSGSATSGPSKWEIERAQEVKLKKAAMTKLLECVDLQKSPSEDLIVELILGGLWDDLCYNGGLMELLRARGMAEFDVAEGDNDERARLYLEEVVRPEIARAPMAWVALILFENYEDRISLREPVQSDPLLRILSLDRETILAAEETTEEPVEAEA